MCPPFWRGSKIFQAKVPPTLKRGQNIPGKSLFGEGEKYPKQKFLTLERGGKMSQEKLFPLLKKDNITQVKVPPPLTGEGTKYPREKALCIEEGGNVFQ